MFQSARTKIIFLIGSLALLANPSVFAITTFTIDGVVHSISESNVTFADDFELFVDTPDTPLNRSTHYYLMKPVNSGTLNVRAVTASTDATVKVYKVFSDGATELLGNNTANNCSPATMGLCTVTYIQSSLDYVVVVNDSSPPPGYIPYSVSLDVLPDKGYKQSDFYFDNAINRFIKNDYLIGLDAYKASLNKIDEGVSSARMVIGILDAGSTIYQLPESSTKLSATANQLIKIGAQDPFNNDPNALDMTSRLIDASYAVYAFGTGDPLPAIQSLATDSAEIITYGVGIWKTYQVDRELSANILAFKVLKQRILEGTIQKSITKDELVKLAEGIAADSESKCSIFSDVFQGCGLGQYDPDYFVAYYNNLATLFTDKINRFIELGNPYSDVDNDGVINTLDLDPNNPDITVNQNIGPTANIGINTTTYIVGDPINIDGSKSSNPNNLSISYNWHVYPPEGSNIAVSNQDTQFTLVPDVAGTYTIFLTVSDGVKNNTISKIIEVKKVYDKTELVELEQGKFAYTNIDLGGCELKQIDTITVPINEIWKQVTFATSRGGIDVVLLLDDDALPATKGVYGCPSYTQNFDSDMIFDLFEQGGFPDWDKDLLPGSKLRFALFSYGGISNYQFTVDITKDNDKDGDGVPDNVDKFPDDSSEQYDSDNDGIGDNSDFAPNDPARSSNSPPVINVQNTLTVDSNEQYTLPLNISDPDSDVTSIEIISAPQFVHLSNQSLLIYPGLNDIGEYAIQVKAYDKFGMETKATVNLTVNNKTGNAISNALFEEDFNNGLGKWSLYGSPLPAIVNGVYGHDEVFDNRGDSSYQSGAVSKESIDLSNGGVIESDVYLDFYDLTGCWATDQFGLSQDSEPELSSTGMGSYAVNWGITAYGDACWATDQQYRRHAWFGFNIRASDGTTDSPTDRISADDYVNNWHKAKIIIRKDHYVEFYIDSTLMWTSTKQIDETYLTDRKLYIRGRSSGSAGKAYNDNVRVTSLVKNNTAVDNQHRCAGIYKGKGTYSTSPSGQEDVLFAMLVTELGNYTLIGYDQAYFDGFLKTGGPISEDGAFFDSDVDGSGTIVAGICTESNFSGTFKSIVGNGTFTADKLQYTGIFKDIDGRYSGTIDGSLVGGIIGFLSADGKVFFYLHGKNSILNDIEDGGWGEIQSNGSISGVTLLGVEFKGKLDSQTGSISGTYLDSLTNYSGNFNLSLEYSLPMIRSHSQKDDDDFASLLIIIKRVLDKRLEGAQ